MTKKGNKDFENSTKCWICDNAYFEGDIKKFILISLEIEVSHIEIAISILN